MWLSGKASLGYSGGGNDNVPETSDQRRRRQLPKNQEEKIPGSNPGIAKFLFFFGIFGEASLLPSIIVIFIKSLLGSPNVGSISHSTV